MFTKFLKDESGATAIEYTLLAALIGVAIIGGLEALEDKMTSTLGEAASKL
ncbi:MAG: Flp family type IVb pilin [Pseudomonadota bacterium]